MAKGLPRGIYEKQPGSKIYWIRYTDSAGRERREKCGNITAAKTRLSIRHAEKAQGLSTNPPRTVLFSSLIDDAIAYAKSENDEYGAKDFAYKCERLRAEFASTPASRITQATIIAWLQSESERRKWSPATRNRYQAAWSLIFSVGIRNKKIRENAASGITRKREDNQRTRYLTREEEMTLASAIEERFPSYVPVFLLALHTGMRASELLRSRVGDYDARSGMFRVRQKKDRTAPAFRYVPATPVSVGAYDTLAAGKAIGTPLCSKQQKSEDSALTEMRYWFEPCVETAKLKDFLWHDIRHTFASRLVMEGVPLAAVAQYMGHKNISMTTRYSHMSPNTHTRAVEAMMSFYPQIQSGTGNGTGTIGLVKSQANAL